MKNLFIFCLLLLFFEACEKEEIRTPVVANFTTFQEELTNCAPIQFSSQSKGDNLMYSWEFPGGEPSFSNEQSPKIHYEMPGTYTIKLTVTDGFESDEIVKEDFIEVEGITEEPYDGTVWINPNHLKSDMPSSFVTLSSKEDSLRTLFDGESLTWIEVEAMLFDANYEDGHKIEVQVHPSYTIEDANRFAEQYAFVIGQFPKFLLSGVNTLIIQDGGASFWGGSGVIIVTTSYGESLESQGFVEEIMFHEAGHASLDPIYRNDAEWRAAKWMDDVHLSTYARDNSEREDLAETIGPYLALRYFSENLSDEEICTLETAIPNRIAFLDAQDFDVSPWQ